MIVKISMSVLLKCISLFPKAWIQYIYFCVHSQEHCVGSCLHTSGLEDGSCRGDQMAGISANILVLRLSVTEPEEQLRTAEAGGSWPPWWMVSIVQAPESVSTWKALCIHDQGSCGLGKAVCDPTVKPWPGAACPVNCKWLPGSGAVLPGRAAWLLFLLGFHRSSSSCPRWSCSCRMLSLLLMWPSSFLWLWCVSSSCPCWHPSSLLITELDAV